MADEHNDHEQNDDNNESHDSETNNANEKESTESAHADHGDYDEHHGPSFQMYMIVFGVLSVCTLVSFATNWLQTRLGFDVTLSLLIIMAVSVVKATLVAMIFMHLKWDWIKIYIILVPIVILTFMMMLVLMPDTVQSDLDETGPPSVKYSGHVPTSE